MDIKELVDKLSPDQFPIALGGCKNDSKSFDCCEYDITVFDEKQAIDSIFEFQNEFVKLHHGSMTETDPKILVQYSNLKILWDEKWELKIFLSKILEKKEKIFPAYTKSCLIEAAVCATKSKDAIKNSDQFGSSWVKCAAYYLADAIALANYLRPSPTHMLEQIRELEKNSINENFAKVIDCLGIERATQSQLSRMLKSTMGFSDMVENNGHSKIIEAKYEYFVKNSLISNCYFYLGYINRNNFIKIKDALYKKPELFHVLKVAFDVENDITIIEHQSDLLHKTANDLISLLRY